MSSTGIIWSICIVTVVDICLRWIISLRASHRTCHDASGSWRSLSYVGRSQLSPLVTHGVLNPRPLRVLAPGLLAVETGCDAIRTANHLCSRSEQVLSWVIQEAVIDVGATTSDHCCRVLRHHGSIAGTWRLILSVGANESLLGEEVIWTRCSLLWKHSWMIALTGKRPSTEGWGAQAVLGVLVVDHNWITRHLFSHSVILRH